MSELTQCNYCTLESIKSRARREGKLVFSSQATNGGINIYMRGRDEESDYRSPDDGNKQWLAWFMELSDHCVC